MNRPRVTHEGAVGGQLTSAPATLTSTIMSLTYSLENDAAGHFAINASTGAVTVAGPIDYNVAHSWDIAVRVSDGTHVGGKAFTINVIDVPNRARC
jgi:hypothetical protein